MYTYSLYCIKAAIAISFKKNNGTLRSNERCAKFPHFLEKNCVTKTCFLKLFETTPDPNLTINYEIYLFSQSRGTMRNVLLTRASTKLS